MTRLIDGFFPNQPVVNMIRTMFLPGSSSRSSQTACLMDWCCSSKPGFWKISPQFRHGWMLSDSVRELGRVVIWVSGGMMDIERVEDAGEGI